MAINRGHQLLHPQNFDGRYVWAVHDGDIGAVPIPATIWLFGSGLLGLIGFSKRKKAA